MWAERGLFSRRATKEKRMTDFSETDIRTALSQVRDPAGDMDIIASGRVQGLVLRGPNVGFSLDVAGLAETALAELAVVTAVSDAASPAARAQAFVDAVTDLIRKVGIDETDARIQAADWEVLAHAAMDESDGYVSPRLLTKPEIMDTLKRITAG